MVSTPADYMRFGQMLLNGGMLDGKRVLSRESVKELLQNQLPPSLTPFTTPVWDHQGYGFGLGGGVLVVPTATNKPASPGTYRWPGSSGTFFWADPAADLVALIFHFDPGSHDAAVALGGRPHRRHLDLAVHRIADAHWRQHLLFQFKHGEACALDHALAEQPLDQAVGQGRRHVR